MTGGSARDGGTAGTRQVMIRADAGFRGPMKPRSTFRSSHWFLLLALALVFVLPSVWVPRLPCLFRWSTGLPCLSCGATRTVLALSRLDLGQALRMNPLVALVLSGVFVIALQSVVAGALGVRAWRLDVHRRSVLLSLRIGVPLAILANWAYLIAVGR